MTKSPAKKSTGKNKATKTTAIKANRKPVVKTGAKKKAATTAGKDVSKKTTKPAAKPTAKNKVKKAAKKPAARKGGVLKKAAAARAPFPVYRGTMPYIFISYSHADLKEVFRFIKQLNVSRYRIWFDEGIEPGNEWPEVVGRAVLECSQFIIFMSPSAVDSRNVRNEINLATSADKNIIVIYLKSTTLSEGLLLQIGTVQYFNKFEMADKEFIDKLKRVLSNDLHN